MVRHGIALPHGTPGAAEDARPLTSKGRKRMAKVARELRRLGVATDRIVSSPLLLNNMTRDPGTAAPGEATRLARAGR